MTLIHIRAHVKLSIKVINIRGTRYAGRFDLFYLDLAVLALLWKVLVGNDFVNCL